MSKTFLKHIKNLCSALNANDLTMRAAILKSNDWPDKVKLGNASVDWKIRLWDVIQHLQAAQYKHEVDYRFDLWLWQIHSWTYILPAPGHDMSVSTAGVHAVFNHLNRSAERYGYWNNTEKPRNVSARSWAMRKRIWDRLITNSDEAVRLQPVNLEIFGAADIFGLTFKPAQIDMRKFRRTPQGEVQYKHIQENFKISLRNLP